MIHTQEEILSSLIRLDEQTAASMESETLDFKECDTEAKLRELSREYAVCLGNNAGGTVVFGVKDNVVGRSKAVMGIDFAPDLDALNSHLYDSIDPKLVVKFDWILDAGKRLLLMHVISSTPPYTTSSGHGWIRVGKDCKPLTGSLLRQLREGAGLSDPTRDFLPLANPVAAISPAALDILRREMRRMAAPLDLVDLSERELCEKLGIIRDGKLTFGGLLVSGREEILADAAPHHEWKYSRMRSDTDYETEPISGRECILVALEKISLLLQQQNLITTLPSGLFHAEFPQYPIIALREVLLNAFAHRDYTIPGLVFIRHWRDRIEINSPGSFVGGVAPENILHHPPATRNRYLVETILLATRLVNRSNLGVPRMFRALLEEGKEPPEFNEVGKTVRVTFPGQDADKAFRRLIHFLVEQQNAELDVDTLLLLHFFHRRHEARWSEVREAYPYDDRRLREKLAEMENRLFVIAHTGGGRGADTVYKLSHSAATILSAGNAHDLAQRLDREAMKARIVSSLIQKPLRNQDLQSLTNLDRFRVTILMREMAQEGKVRLEGRGPGAFWYKVE